MRATAQHFPGLANWTNWCYSQKSVLLYDHSELIESSCGAQQGDPLGPFYFCLALAPLVEEIQALRPQYQKWYMDDGGIVASVPVLLKVWQLLKEKGPSFGLHLNPAKCEWSWLNASTTSDCPAELRREQVALVPTDQVCILGVPLGSASFAASFVQERLFKRVKPAMERLQELNDSQSALVSKKAQEDPLAGRHNWIRSTHCGRKGGPTSGCSTS